MAKYNVIRNNLTGGEISPRALSRTDLDMYSHCAKELTNVIVHPEGGASRRPGTEFVAGDVTEILGPTAGRSLFDEKIRIIPYSRSKDESAVIVIRANTDGSAYNATTNCDMFYANVSPNSTNSTLGTRVHDPSQSVMSRLKLFEVEWIENYAIANTAATTLDPANTALTAGSSIVIVASADYFSPGHVGTVFSLHSGTVRMTTFTNATTATFLILTTLSADTATASWSVYGPGRKEKFGGYTEAQIDEVQYSISGDLIVLTHPEVMPVHIRCLGSTVTGFKFVCYPYNNTPTFRNGTVVTHGEGAQTMYALRDINTNASHTLDPAATALTAGSNIVIVSSLAYFNSNMVGSIFVLHGGLVELVTFDTSVSCTFHILVTMSADTATADWYESSWSDYRGWPRTSAFYDGRLFYGGNVSQGDTIWGSAVNSPQTLQQTSPASIQFTLNSPEISKIQWMLPGKRLRVGTQSREILVYGRDETSALSSSNIFASFEASSGSSYVQPAQVGNAIFFLDRTYRVAKEFVFNFQEDSFRSDSISTLSEHMVHKSQSMRVAPNAAKFIRMAYQAGNTSVVWFVDSNGFLIGCTRDRQLGVAAWHFHVIGGVYKNEAAFVEDVCVIPSADGTNDDVYLSVRRTINGNDVRYIERIPQEFRKELLFDDLNKSTDGSIFTLVNGSVKYVYAEKKPSYVDCQWVSRSAVPDSALTQPKSPTTTFYGFEHLIDQDVAVVVDGAYVGTKTVNYSANANIYKTGIITTDYDAYEVIAGFPYTHTIVPVPIEAGSAIGSGHTQIQRINKAILRFYRTVAAMIGRDVDHLEDISFFDSAAILNGYTAPFTGLKEIDFGGEYGRETNIVIQSDYPLPFTLVSISMQGTTYD